MEGLYKVPVHISGSKLMRVVKARSEAPVKAAISVEDVQRAFFQEFATGDRYWWWICEHYLDPDVLIVNDGEDNLYRVGYTVVGNDPSGVIADDAGAVTFDDPTPVKMQYVAAIGKPEQNKIALRAMSSTRGSEKVAASFDSREASRRVVSKSEGGNGEVNIEQLRKALNLPADTPDDEVIRLASERLVAQAQETTDPDDGGSQGGDEGTESGDDSDDGGKTSLDTQDKPAEGVVSIDSGALAALKEAAERGAGAADKLEEQETEQILQEALAKGKIPASRRDHWKNLLKADRTGTIETLKSLEENVIPVALRGDHGGGSEDLTGAPQTYPAHWLPDVAARKAALAAHAQQGTVPRVLTDRAYGGVLENLGQ